MFFPGFPMIFWWFPQSSLVNISVSNLEQPQEHQQAVEEEFGPENFVVVVRGLLDEADRAPENPGFSLVVDSGKTLEDDYD